MSKWNRYKSVMEASRSEDFERRVNEAVSNAVDHMDRMVDDEVKLQYVTHVFAKTLDQLESWLDGPRMVN